MLISRKTIYNNWKHVLILMTLGTCSLAIVLLIQRGLHGEYGLGVHGFSILFLVFFPFVVVFFARRSTQGRPLFCASCALAVIVSIFLVLSYLSSNGLWCAQHPKVAQKMCAKLHQFASFAASVNLTSWWVTLGDLLAIERGRVMPLPWEHDIDVCVALEQFPLFEKALRSRGSYFHPAAEHLERGHWYLPIDMRELGLRAREAEGVNIDIWTCPQLFTGNITRVFYCDGLVNIPGSLEERHSLLTKEYGDYSVVTYEHHATMCRMWNG